MFSLNVNVTFLLFFISASQHDHSDNDCFVVIVLSHGEMGVVYAKDDHYEQETLWTNFTAVKCSSLVGKPKLFFIQVSEFCCNYNYGMILKLMYSFYHSFVLL